MTVIEQKIKDLNELIAKSQGEPHLQILYKMRDYWQNEAARGPDITAEVNAYSSYYQLGGSDDLVFISGSMAALVTDVTNYLKSHPGIYAKRSTYSVTYFAKRKEFKVILTF